MSEEFIGRGWAFPLQTDKTGSILTVSREREIEESIALILGTMPGERPMRPEYGCGIHDYVFATLDPDTVGRMAAEVRASLARWEPRIRVQGVDITVGQLPPPSPGEEEEQERGEPDEDSEQSAKSRHPADKNVALVQIQYSIGDTNDPRNLVFPFYTIPAEE